MKNKKIIATLMAPILLFLMCFTTIHSFAHTKKHNAMMKDCCMMKDGKMMCMKKGKITPMKKDMTMQNGTKCMSNGECIMKNGEKMQMKDGECMDMKGKMDNFDMMNKMTKSENMKKDMAITYTCSMHPEVIRDKPGKCPKCGMALVKKR